MLIVENKSFMLSAIRLSVVAPHNLAIVRPSLTTNIRLGWQKTKTIITNLFCPTVGD